MCELLEQTAFATNRIYSLAWNKIYRLEILYWICRKQRKWYIELKIIIDALHLLWKCGEINLEINSRLHGQSRSRKIKNYSFVRMKHLADTRGGISYVLCVCATATILHCLWMCACVDGILSSFFGEINVRNKTSIRIQMSEHKMFDAVRMACFHYTHLITEMRTHASDNFIVDANVYKRPSNKID